MDFATVLKRRICLFEGVFLALSKMECDFSQFSHSKNNLYLGSHWCKSCKRSSEKNEEDNLY